MLCEAGLAPASTLLDYRQRLYAYRLLNLPDQHPAKEILPVSLREGDAAFQPEELPENNLVWTQDARPALFGQWLAWQIIIDHSIDPADGVKPVTIIKPGTQFQGKVVIECKQQALKEAKKDTTGLTIWTDGAKLANGNCGAAVCWKDGKLANGNKKRFSREKQGDP